VLLRRELNSAREKYSETEKAFYDERNALEIELESQVIYNMYSTMSTLHPNKDGNENPYYSKVNC
jgi:hypothetical protein